VICQNCGNENVGYARFCLVWRSFQAQRQVQPPQPKLGDDPWMRALLPVGKAPLAVVAGWVGLLSLVCCPIIGPVAMVLSVVALVDLNHNPEKRGKGRAVFGVVAGSIASLIALAFLLNLR
jgi:hypothetical protein